MGGFFGLVGKADIVEDLFYGTDYHSHLGTKRGGLAVGNGTGIVRYIHNIENAQFRSKFEDDVAKLHGRRGIGVISDYEDQPLLIRSHLGHYAIVTVGVVKNIDELVARAFKGKCLHFSEMRGGEVNPTELVATLINQKDTFEDGIRHAWELVRGSCSILVLTGDGIYAARDRLGRTPVVLGRKDGTAAATMETCAFPNLDYEIDRYLGPGEIVRLTPEGAETLAPPGQAADLLLPLGLLRLSRVELRGHQRRDGAQPLRRDAGPRRRGRDRSGRRHPGLGHRPRIRLRDRGGGPLPASLRQVHADLAPELHAPGPGPP